MSEPNDINFYIEREKQERALAASAGDPTIANIHLEMAEHYRSLIDDRMGSDPATTAPHRMMRTGADNRRSF